MMNVAEHEEAVRSRVQHAIWQPFMRRAGSRAGIQAGWRVLDVGAGPGYSTIELARLVGPEGEVIALDRSRGLLTLLEDRCRGLANVHARDMDLMHDDMVAWQADAAWCRSVAGYVSSPAKLIGKLKMALKHGGVAIFHECADSRTWRLGPRRPAFEEFVTELMAGESGRIAEDAVALVLPTILTQAGFCLTYVAPVVFAVHPADHFWKSLMTWVVGELQSWVRVGRVRAAWADGVLSAIVQAEAHSSSTMITPMMMEIVAQKP